MYPSKPKCLLNCVPGADLEVDGDGVDDGECGLLLAAQHAREHLRVVKVAREGPVPHVGPEREHDIQDVGICESHDSVLTDTIV